MRKICYSLGIFGLACMMGCATGAKVIPGATGETLTWSSEDKRPGWTIEEPAIDGDTMLFVGLAEKYATEPEARDQAMRNVTNQVVRYLGTMAKDKYEKLAVSYGLTSSVVDPTASSREYEKQLAANVAKKVKAKKWYLEKWQTPTGTGYKAFVMATVPTESINDSFKNTAKENMEAAQRKAKEAADDVAKKQADDAAKFWEGMSKQGVVE
ncbi:MAG: hypothetical protein HZA78_03810 [Candidatus Schekmanbacteria bacterium]|nr:hypothetical protein [Candidatus Schekmanbacteria bacterium]